MITSYQNIFNSSPYEQVPHQVGEVISSPLETLPPEVMGHIFNYLSDLDKGYFALTCTKTMHAYRACPNAKMSKENNPKFGQVLQQFPLALSIIKNDR